MPTTNETGRPTVALADVVKELPQAVGQDDTDRLRRDIELCRQQMKELGVVVAELASLLATVGGKVTVVHAGQQTITLSTETP